MELIFDVFDKLNIDQTFFVQFVLVVFFFFTLKSLLFSKLQFVIELREGKTTKMEDEANKKFAKAEELSKKFTQETEEAYSEAHQYFSSQKKEITTREWLRFKKAEESLEKEASEEKQKYIMALEAQRDQVLGQSDQLAEDLVQKIVH